MTSVLELGAAWLAASIVLCLVLANVLGRAERRSGEERIFVPVAPLASVPLASVSPASVPMATLVPAAPPRPLVAASMSATWVTSTRRPPEPRPAVEAGSVDAR